MVPSRIASTSGIASWFSSMPGTREGSENDSLSTKITVLSSRYSERVSFIASAASAYRAATSRIVSSL